ncbi:MAG: beta-ketoacyl-[acyl-carrier-protein] synthase family protein [Phycisphaerae bacterium]|nr:beta-ketoacyl-[acyl-carrier-protein] synthase family protein [Phycisphaerae bacterium]
MAERRVVITGLGPVSPIGVGKDQFLASLRSGRVAVDGIRAFDAAEFPCRIAGEIAEFSCKDYVPKSYRKSIKVMARDIELAVVAADCAVRDSGLKTKGVSDGEITVDSTRLGVNIGAGLICPDLNELTFALASASNDGQFSLEAWGREGMNNLTPLWLLKYLPNMLACHVSIIHDAQAPSNTITCAEASSQLAIGEAWRTIKRDCADVCLCGGAESKVNPMGLLRQDLIGRLTRSHNDSPASAVRPFDAKRDGTVIAEGGAVVVLEDLEHAKRREGRIYGEMIGLGAGFGTHDFLNPDRNGDALAVVLEKALADAQVEACDVDLVVAFACGLPEHDRVEAQAIARVLGDVPVTSIKSQYGNNGAGSGALDVAAAALCLSEGLVPGTVNCEQVDPACPVNVVRRTEDRRVNTLLTVNYSLSGGQCTALVFRRWAG